MSAGQRPQSSQKEGPGLALAELRKRDQEEELSPEQAAEEAGVVRQTIYLWLRRKGDDKLPARKHGRGGRQWKIRRGDLVAFLDSGRHRADDERQTPTDEAARGMVLSLLEVAQACVRWREASSIYDAQGARFAGDVIPTEADAELLMRLYTESVKAHEALRDAIGKLSGQKLTELREAVERGDLRILVAAGVEELILTLGGGEDRTKAEHPAH